MRLEKIKNNLYKVLLAIFFILMLYSTYCAIFNISKAPEELKPIVIVIGMIVLIRNFYKVEKNY